MLCVSQGDVAPTPSLANGEAGMVTDKFRSKFSHSIIYTPTVQLH